MGRFFRVAGLVMLAAAAWLLRPARQDLDAAVQTAVDLALMDLGQPG